MVDAPRIVLPRVRSRITASGTVYGRAIVPRGCKSFVFGRDEAV